YARTAGQDNSASKQAVRQQLLHWQADPDLASVREPQSLDRLPENERNAWLALWRDVDELAKRLGEKAADGRWPRLGAGVCRGYLGWRACGRSDLSTAVVGGTTGGPPRRRRPRGCRMDRRLRGCQDAREEGASSAGSGGTPGKGRR